MQVEKALEFWPGRYVRPEAGNMDKDRQVPRDLEILVSYAHDLDQAVGL